MALTIKNALDFELALKRPADGSLKAIPAHAYNLTDLVNHLQGITVSYEKKTHELWLEGLPKNNKNEITRICRACGTVGAYTTAPDYLSEDPLGLSTDQ